MNDVEMYEEKMIDAWNSFRQDPTQMLKAQTFASAVEKVDPLKAIIVYSYILDMAENRRGFNGGLGYEPLMVMLHRHVDGLRESAAKTIEGEIREKPNNIDLRLNLAEVHKIRGEYFAARDQYVIARDLAQKNKDMDRKIFAEAEIKVLEKILDYN